MREFPTYPEIESIDQVKALRLFNRVIATEKVDGTNVRIGWVEGHLRFGGRTIELTSADPLYGFYPWAQAQEDRWTAFFEGLHLEGTDAVLFGEWYGPGVMKGGRYGAEKQFRAFDLMIDGFLLDHAVFTTICESAGIPMMPVVYDGPYDESALLALRTSPSVVAAENGQNNVIWEGIVVRPPIMFKTKADRWILAKFKDETFEERTSLRKTPFDPAVVEAAEAFAKEWVTPQRLDHVLQHAREQGVMGDSMRDMGPILRLMHQDVRRESHVSDELWKSVNKQVSLETKGLFQTYLMEVD